MKTSLTRAGLFLAALALAGCNESLEDISPKAEKRLPAEIVESMHAKGMRTTSPIMVRIFKEEAKLEVWKQKDTGRYDLIKSYDICKWSGKLGPKFTEGDRQAPEGFYMVRPHQMNPRSSYHLSFNIGFPNAYDQAHGRTGQHLMVHGACSSAGCYSMTDEQVEQIYAFARDAFRGGQTEFQIQAFPFRMTAANMARYSSDPNYEFWKMLKEGYDHFEITKVPPKVDVCGKRYVFNQVAGEGQRFSAMASCPMTTQPQSLTVAYRSYQQTFDAAFSAALDTESSEAPSPTINGLKEARLVSEWSRRRARGEKVTRLPPTLEQPHILASEVPKKQALEQTVAVVPTPAPEEQVAAPAAQPIAGSPVATLSPIGRLLRQPAVAAVEEQAPAQPQAAAEEPAPSAQAAEAEAAVEQPAAEQRASDAAPIDSAQTAEAKGAGMLPNLGIRKRLGNLFGN